MGDPRRDGGGSRWRAAFAIALAVAPACSVTADLDGLSGGDPAIPIPPHDASARDAADATLADSAPPPEDTSPPPDDTAPADAGVDAPPIDASCTYSAVTFGAPNAVSPAFGGDSGTPYDDPCPAGSALVGINGARSDTSPNSLTQLQGVCAPITAGACGARFGAASTLPVHGGTTGPPASAMCPAGSVVVGVVPRTGLWVDALALHCAPLLVGASGVSLGSATTTVSVGGTGGSPASPYDCPAPQMITRLRGGSGSFVDRVELVCATLAR